MDLSKFVGYYKGWRIYKMSKSGVYWAVTHSGKSTIRGFKKLGDIKKSIRELNKK